MSNNKQSSVEWLYQEFERIDKEFHVGSHEYNYAKNLAFKISKAMHKEEHGETFTQGVRWIQYQRDLVEGGSEYWDEEPKQFDEYYNETFGDNNNS